MPLRTPQQNEPVTRTISQIPRLLGICRPPILRFLDFMETSLAGVHSAVQSRMFSAWRRALSVLKHGTDEYPKFAPDAASDYAARRKLEAEHWQEEVAREGSEIRAWLDHPDILAFYVKRRRIDSLDWPEWLPYYFGGQADSAAELGCGSGSWGIKLLDLGVVKRVIGYDVSAGRLSVALEHARKGNRRALYVLQDVNGLSLREGAFDLIFSCHSFHHFSNLEAIMDQIQKGLTPRGLFILEEFVGPSVFQWTDLQLQVTNDLLALLPPRFRRCGHSNQEPANLKNSHPRPRVEDVQAVSPFEAIRSEQILPLFRERFKVIYEKPLGGTIQHLLYDGIIHNFAPGDPEASLILKSIDNLEELLIRGGALPSDFMLLVGGKKT